jgi:predicted Rossmann-fold nucleotide-binding protein
MKPFPVILYDSRYWNGLLQWLRNTTLAGGYISETDLGLLVVCDNVADVVKTVHDWYDNQEIAMESAMDTARSASSRPPRRKVAHRHE